MLETLVILLSMRSQSAGNLFDLNHMRILRDYTPKVIFYKKPLIKRYSSNKTNFENYFTGLIEGDGTIFVPKTEYSDKGKKNYPAIQIAFHLKEFPLAMLIQKNLGTGSLNRKKGVNAYTLTINSNVGIQQLVELLNGNMRTPKIYSLYKLIDWLNHISPELNLKKLPIRKTKFDEDAWLSGFIEADGHFSVRSGKVGTFNKVECKFELVQRQLDHLGNNNEIFLKDIGSFLKAPVKKIRENRSYPQVRIRTLNKESNNLLIGYLKKYPLFGSKYLDYLNWHEIFLLFEPRFKSTERNLELVSKIKLEMNDRRTFFVWDHLKDFYNIDY